MLTTGRTYVLRMSDRKDSQIEVCFVSLAFDAEQPGASGGFWGLLFKFGLANFFVSARTRLFRI